jgi:hypothetical protein
MYGVNHEQVAHSLQFQDRVRGNPRLAATLHPYMGGYRADGQFVREVYGLYFVANDTSVSFARERVIEFSGGNPFAAPTTIPDTPLAAYLNKYVRGSRPVLELFAYPFIKQPGKVYGDPITLADVYPIAAAVVWAHKDARRTLPRWWDMLGYAARVHATEHLDPAHLEAYYAEALQYQVLSANTDADILHVLDILRP